MIKNTTVYAGTPRLRFKKSVDYMPSSQVLNKVHLNLGFTKLISVVPTAKYDIAKLRLIGNHTNTIVKGVRLSHNGIVATRPGVMTVPCFIGEDYCTTGVFNQIGKYLGSPEFGWFLYQEGLRMDTFQEGIAFSEQAQGWLGITHRGTAIFKMYDMEFDPDWIPEEPFDYIIYWYEPMKELCGGDLGGCMDKLDSFKKLIVEYIPYHKRGNRLIVDLDQAKVAALNYYRALR